MSTDFPTPLASELIGTGETAAVVADLAHRAEQVHRLDVPDLPPGILVLDRPTGVGTGRRVEVLDLEAYLGEPRFRSGSTVLREPDSFVRHVLDQRGEATTLWADPDAGRVEAVLDDHGGPEVHWQPGWGRHRATLQLQPTPEWLHWKKLDGKLVGQAQFAEHVEDGITVVAAPPAAELLEACRTLSVKREVSFSSADRPHSGEIRFSYTETDTAKAGRGGDIELPETFVLFVAPWRGVDPVEVIGRLSYRLVQGQLQLGYRLVRPDDAVRAGFEQVLLTVRGGTEIEPFIGTPRG